MKKKNYIAPAVEVVEITEAQGIMAASGEPAGVNFDDTNEIGGGYSIASKERSDIWDFDEE